jgi:hypothetical protein
MAIGFPTQGVLIKFAFDATGVLPRKRGELDGMSETDKKNIQKSLERLASEEGNLSDRCDDLIRTLVSIIAGNIKNGKLALAMGDVAFDLFEVYRAVIRSDGSYLEKHDTVRWFTSTYVIGRLVLSVNKHLLRYNIIADGLITPEDPYWFLPSIDGTKITWPLEKVMRWVYVVCDTTQTHFHYPGKHATSSSFEQQQRLDNASNWLETDFLQTSAIICCTPTSQPTP